MLSDPDSYILVNLISRIPNGFKTNSFPSSKSAFYSDPFLIFFNVPTTVKSNYLEFNNYFQPNSEHSILALLNFDEEKNRFTADFSPGIILSSGDFLLLHNILEFRIVDVKKHPVLLEDDCQLFINLIIE